LKDKLVTLFGGGGFVGRYAAQALLKAGARVRIVQRDPRRAWFLKPLGGLGQTQFLRASITDRRAVEAAAHGSDAVVNLVGILRGDYQAVHVDGARNVAEAAAASGAKALVHVSAIGADPASDSAYGHSKAEGEAAVRAAFPQAIILRPSLVFGREDAFVNKFAAMARLMPVLPVLRGAVAFQPVYVADVGRAIAAAALDPGAHAGKSYELGGPETITMRELNRRICEASGRKRALLEIPDAIGALMARATGWLPGAPINWDEWLMLQHDNVASGPGLAGFGIAPTPLAAVTDGWLTSYRRHGRFAAQPTG